MKAEGTCHVCGKEKVEGTVTNCKEKEFLCTRCNQEKSDRTPGPADSASWGGSAPRAPGKDQEEPQTKPSEEEVKRIKEQHKEKIARMEQEKAEKGEVEPMSSYQQMTLERLEQQMQAVLDERDKHARNSGVDLAKLRYSGVERREVEELCKLPVQNKAAWLKSWIEPIYQEITFLESGGILGPKDKKKMQSRVRVAIKNFSKDGDVWKDEPKDKDEVDESSMMRPEKGVALLA